MHSYARPASERRVLHGWAPLADALRVMARGELMVFGTPLALLHLLASRGKRRLVAAC